MRRYDSVCGPGCASRVLHLDTDYPVIPRACLPELATILELTQAADVRAALASSSAFGVTVVARPSATDLYVATDERIHGSPVYRGLHQAQYMFECNDSAGETWVISAGTDRSAWSRCEGDLWIALETAQARDDATDLATQIGAAQFDLSLARCGQDGMLSSAAFPPDFEATENLRTISFPDDAGPYRIACSLALLFGPHNVASRTPFVTVRLPSSVREFDLVTDVVV